MRYLQAPQQGSGLSEGIRLTEERLPNSRMRVSVEVPATSVRWYYERVLQSSRKNLDIPGFRKGKKVRLLCGKQVCCSVLGLLVCSNAEACCYMQRSQQDTHCSMECAWTQLHSALPGGRPCY